MLTRNHHPLSAENGNSSHYGNDVRGSTDAAIPAQPAWSDDLSSAHLTEAWFCRRLRRLEAVPRIEKHTLGLKTSVRFGRRPGADPGIVALLAACPTLC